MSESAANPTLIQGAELLGREGLWDIRLRGDRVTEVDRRLERHSFEQVITANACLLLPGLHDHHLHLMALAAAQNSLRLGPGHIDTPEAFHLAAQTLRPRRGEWLRVTGYDPSIVGELDLGALDKLFPDHPVRVQHRGGRLWQLNSVAIETLIAQPGIEFNDQISPAALRANGQLIDNDRWLSGALRATPPDLSDISQKLAGYGITSVTDTTPTNTRVEWQYFADAYRRSELKQRVRVMGTEDLDHCEAAPGLSVGELKLHLLESALPPFDTFCQRIRAAHNNQRSIAVHCVTRTELVYTLSAFTQIGTREGDRIEHASVCPPELIEQLQALGLRVVTQPGFLYERGDRYLNEVAEEDIPWLYRCRGLSLAGIPLAAGSDAPFATENPWQHLQSAVDRRTLAGQLMNGEECLEPEDALRLYLSDASTPGMDMREVAVGSTADLCLLDRPWASARASLADTRVRATWASGVVVHCSDAAS